MATEKIPADHPEDEEVSAEIDATNEGMPAGETDEAPEDPRVIQSPEAFDAAKRRKNPAVPANTPGDKSGESKGAAAGE